MEFKLTTRSPGFKSISAAAQIAQASVYALFPGSQLRNLGILFTKQVPHKPQSFVNGTSLQHPPTDYSTPVCHVWKPPILYKTENPEAIKNLVRFIVPQFFSYSIMWHMCPPSPHFVHIELKDEFQTEERKD